MRVYILLVQPNLVLTDYYIHSHKETRFPVSHLTETVTNYPIVQQQVQEAQLIREKVYQLEQQHINIKAK